MPSSKVKTSSGSVNFRYNIATPSNGNAKSIDKSLPTLLFVHAEYMSAEGWQYLFDSNLRRFNLVAFDLRGHGETGGKVPSTYSRVEAADDIVKFMDSIKLPACHIVGNSIGADIALQMSIVHPEKVASIVLLAPIPDQEDPDVTEGRQQVFDYWREGVESGDHAGCADAVFGAMSMGLNNQDGPLVQASITINVDRSKKNWGVKNFDVMETTTVKYFLNNRTLRTSADFGKINCPVLILHSLKALVDTTETVEKLEHSMQAAGVTVQVIKVEAPQFGAYVKPSLYIKPIDKFVSALCPNGAPPAPTKTTSPWESDLRKAGWKPSNESDESDDESSS